MSHARFAPMIAVLVVASGSACATDNGDDALGDEDDCTSSWSEFGVAIGIEAAGPFTGTAVSLESFADTHFALFDAGVLVEFDGYGGETIVSIPSNGLTAWTQLANGDRLVVGVGGQIVRLASGADGWVATDSGTDADLIDVVAAADGAWVLAIADDQLVLSEDSGLTWAEIPGAWAGLNRVFVESGTIWLLADAGVAWTTSDPTGIWAQVTLGGNQDLIAGAGLSFGDRVVLVTADVVHIGEPDGWMSVPAPADEVFRAIDGRVLVTDRAVYWIEPESVTIAEIATLDLVPVDVLAAGDAVYVIDNDGVLGRIEYTSCI